MRFPMLKAYAFGCWACFVQNRHRTRFKLVFIYSLVLSELTYHIHSKNMVFLFKDIEDRVAKTFPTPIDKWALTEARATIDKSRKKKVVLPLNQIQNLLQKVISMSNKSMIMK